MPLIRPARSSDILRAASLSPSITPPELRSGVLGALPRVSAPFSSATTISVKVPPVSIAILNFIWPNRFLVAQQIPSPTISRIAGRSNFNSHCAIPGAVFTVRRLLIHPGHFATINLAAPGTARDTYIRL